MTSHDAKARFGQLLDAARTAPVTINKHGRPVAVVMSKEEFDALEAIKLEQLRAEVQKGIAAIERGEFVEVGRSNLRQLSDSIKSEGKVRSSEQ
jgi:prevent-host-death family protein